MLRDAEIISRSPDSDSNGLLGNISNLLPFGSRGLDDSFSFLMSSENSVSFSDIDSHACKIFNSSVCSSEINFLVAFIAVVLKYYNTSSLVAIAGKIYNPQLSNDEQSILTTGGTYNLNPIAINLQNFMEIVTQVFDTADVSVSIGVVTAKREKFPLLFVNHSFENLTGYESDEVIGKDCKLLQAKNGKSPKVNELQRMQIANLKGALMKGKEYSVMLSNFRKNETKFTNVLLTKPIFDQNGNYRLVIGSQNELTQSDDVNNNPEQRFRPRKSMGEICSTCKQLFDNIPSMVHINDHELDAFMGV
jgi:PAS domain S-box-containing protein